MNSEESTVISFRFFRDPVSINKFCHPPCRNHHGRPCMAPLFFICQGDTFRHFDAGDPVLPPKRAWWTIRTDWQAWLVSPLFFGFVQNTMVNQSLVVQCSPRFYVFFLAGYDYVPFVATKTKGLNYPWGWYKWVSYNYGYWLLIIG